MGTNLSQVFISNTDVLQSPAGGQGTDVFTDVSATPEVGIWNPNGAAAAKWVNTKLYETQFVTADTDTDGSSPAPTTPTSFANPAWLYTHLQFVQGTSGNPIASPLINTRNIRSIKYNKHVVSAMDKWTLDCGSQAGKDITLKIVIRTTPTAQLNFHDPIGSGLMDLSGAGFDFPLSAFNNTHHKVITVQSTPSDSERATDNESTLYDALKARVEQHALLNKLVTMTDNGNSGLVIEARHAGVMIEVFAFNDTDELDIAASRTAGGTVGVGNAWQVLSEEIRCRSRYGNFNRMYLPQNMPTYTKAAALYDKIVIEYEHNWPTSTGIAPAGALNQIVIYNTDADLTAPVVGDAATNTFAAAFGYTIADDTTGKYFW